MRPILIALAIAGLVPAAAQAQQFAPDPMAILVDDWNAYQTAQRHVLSAMNALAAELRKAKDDLATVTKERDDLKAQAAKPQ